MSRRTQRVWVGCDGEYLGAQGVDTLEEMAELITSCVDPDVQDFLLGEDLEPVAPRGVAATRAALEVAGVQPVYVPLSILNRERWGGEHLIPCTIDAPPRRGYAKVLGLLL